MNKSAINANLDLLVFIMNPNECSKVVKMAGEKGIHGGTIFLGEGTVRSKLLKSFGFDNIRREIALLVGLEDDAKAALDHISKVKHLEKKDKGIGFRLPIKNVFGASLSKEPLQLNEERKDKKTMFQAIFVITDRGESDLVMEAAQNSGAQGGTIIHARGAGEYEAKKVFNMDIEPEKDIVLIISNEEKTSEITSGISESLNIGEPNTGIIFVVDLSETRGIFE